MNQNNLRPLLTILRHTVVILIIIGKVIRYLSAHFHKPKKNDKEK